MSRGITSILRERERSGGERERERERTDSINFARFTISVGCIHR